MKKTSTKQTYEIRIVFPTDEAKRNFATWLSDGGGEQQYFAAMAESSTPLLRLSYWPEDEKYARNDKRRYGKFLADSTIRVLEVKEP